MPFVFGKRRIRSLIDLVAKTFPPIYLIVWSAVTEHESSFHIFWENSSNCLIKPELIAWKKNLLEKDWKNDSFYDLSTKLSFQKVILTFWLNK